jgi:hypothetical protein
MTGTRRFKPQEYIRMSVRLLYDGADADEPRGALSDYFEELFSEQGYDNLQEFYDNEDARMPELDYLWSLTTKFFSSPYDYYITFAMYEIDELKERLPAIMAHDYPQSLKTALLRLLTVLEAEKRVKFNTVMKSRGRNQALRNMYERRTGQSSELGNGPLNTIRAYAGIRPPRGARGGRRTKKNKRSKRKASRKKGM